jgi:hypothetical protein
LLILFALVRMADDERRKGIPLAITTRSALLPALVKEASRHCPTKRKQVSCGLNLITMSESTVVGTMFDPELARYRRFRPACRPVVALGRTRIGKVTHDDAVAWVYSSAMDALEDWAVSIVRSVWPFRLDCHVAEENALKKKLLYLRNTAPWARAKALEQLVGSELSKLHGFRIKVNIRESKRVDGNLLPRNGLKLRNQIDVLAVNEQEHIMWVISVKDQDLDLSGRRIRNIRSDFFGKPESYPDPEAYQTKLLIMVEDVASQPDAAAMFCGAASGKSWTVKGAFVTRDLSPAAFDRRLDPNIEFFRLSTVAEMLGPKNPEDKPVATLTPRP